MPDAVLYRRGLSPDERLFGLGDKAAPLDRRGGVYVLWNTDNANFSVGRDPLYKAIPLVFGVSSHRAWCVYVESSARLVFDCGGDVLEVTGPGSPPVHEFAGESFAEVFAQASEIVGRTPLPPRWALGYHQSRWSYASAEEALGVVAEFRRRSIPLDVLHLDIDYMDGYRVFTVDAERFPDLAGLVRELGVRVVTIVDPGVKGYRVFREARSQTVVT